MIYQAHRQRNTCQLSLSTTPRFYTTSQNCPVFSSGYFCTWRSVLTLVTVTFDPSKPNWKTSVNNCLICLYSECRWVHNAILYGKRSISVQTVLFCSCESRVSSSLSLFSTWMLRMFLSRVARDRYFDESLPAPSITTHVARPLIACTSTLIL